MYTDKENIGLYENILLTGNCEMGFSHAYVKSSTFNRQTKYEILTCGQKFWERATLLPCCVCVCRMEGHFPRPCWGASGWIIHGHAHMLGNNESQWSEEYEHLVYNNSSFSRTLPLLSTYSSPPSLFFSDLPVKVCRGAYLRCEHASIITRCTAWWRVAADSAGHGCYADGWLCLENSRGPG